MMTYGYERKPDLRLLDRNLVTYAEWRVSTFRFGPKNSELKIGGIVPVFEKGNFKIVNKLNLSAGSVTTHNFDSQKFAIADEVALGVYIKKWFIAATSEYENIVLNHIKHTEFYRSTNYKDAEVGWYKGAGGMVQFGVKGGGTVDGKYDIHLEVKLPIAEKFNSYRGSPLHANLGLGYRF